MASDVKWLKLMNDMFEDDKISYIESLPDGDTILIIWVKVLCLASKSNTNGSLMITDEIPYTPALMAHKFKKTTVQVEYALSVMKKLEMLDIVNDVIYVSNWTKYQSVDELAKIKEQTRLRVAKCREKKKELECNATSNATVTLKCNENALISNSISNNIDKDNNNKKENILKEKQTDLEKQTLSTNQADSFKALTNESIISNQADTEKQSISKEQTISLDSAIERLYTYWNTLNIVVHRKLTPNMIKYMKRALKEYTEDEIRSAMSNYNTVLKDKNYYFDYVWGLDTFLSQKNCLPHFVDSGEKWLNYCAKTGLKTKNQKKTDYKIDESGVISL